MTDDAALTEESKAALMLLADFCRGPHRQSPSVPGECHHLERPLDEGGSGVGDCPPDEPAIDGDDYLDWRAAVHGGTTPFIRA